MLQPSVFDTLAKLPYLPDAGIAARQSGNLLAVEAIARIMQKFREAPKVAA